MTEPVMSLIDNHHEKQNSESDQSFRRIEFHIAKKPFTGFSNKGDDVGFRAESLNPSTSSSIKSVGGGSSGKKRDASEMENGLDQELTFGITFRRIGAGLENLGNTCFLNSVLQCLTYTEPLAAYLQSGKHQVTCRKSGFCALCSIQKHVNRALQLSGRSLAPKDLVSNLRCISRTFRNSRQEDAHEYMVNLLESMHKCCLPNGVPIESQSAYDKSLVHKIFGGQLRSQVKCMQCNYCSNKFDPFMDLSLEIFKVDTLYKAFANFTAKEQLDGGARQYQCQQCKQKVKALKQLTVYKAPNVLTVHLKRFGCYMSGEKINKKVHFGPTLDLKPFVTGPYDGDLKYTLYGVLVHAGWNMHSGHYYCFVRTSSGMWYSLDDNRVFQVSEKKVFEQKAYMLFYFRDRKNFSSKKTTNANKKETVMMNGETSGLCVPTEAQIKTGLSNLPLNAQTSLKNTADGAHQKENIGMDGTPDRPGASREAQMKTDLRQGNGSLNAHADVAQQKENIGMNGTPDRSGAPREAQMTTDLSKRNGSLNANADAAHQTENIGMNGTPDGPGAAREAQINTDLRKCNGSFAHADVAYQEENIGMNGTPDRPGAPREAQMNTDPSKGNGSLNAHISLATVSAERSLASPVAPKETQTKTILSDYGYSNDDKSLVSVSTLNCSGATKKTQMEIGLSDGLLGSQKCLDAVGIEGTGSDPVAPKEIQTNSSLMNGSLSGLESSAIPTTLTDGFSTGASELERTQTKETSVPESISEPGKTENHTKFQEIGGGESSGGNDGGEGYVEPATALLKISGLPEKESYMEKKALGGKTHNTELSDLPKMDSCMKKKASMRKPLKKTKNLFKGKSISMKFSSTVFMGASLNQRKKKKHKRNKRVKNLAQEILVNESSSSLVKIEAQETAKPAVDNVFKVRLVEAGAVLATRDPNTGSHLNSDKSNLVDISRRSLSQKELVHMLTSGIDDRIVLRWDEDESAPSQIFREKQNNFTIGHVGDQWDEEYDRGKRKKVKISKTEFGGKNTFQVIANERLNLHSEKQNLSKLLQSSSKMPAATKTKRKNNHFQKPRACKGPYRI